MATNEGKLAALLLGVAGAGALIFRAVIGRRLAEERRNLAPVDPDVVAAEFEGIPLYPGAELDRVATAEMRWISTVMARKMRVLTWVVTRLSGADLSEVLRGAEAVYTVEAPAASFSGIPLPCGIIAPIVTTSGSPEPGRMCRHEPRRRGRGDPFGHSGRSR